MTCVPFYTGAPLHVAIPPIAVNAKTAAQLLGISVRQLNGLGLPSFKAGRTRLYRAQTLDAWAREQEETNRWAHTDGSNVTVLRPKRSSHALSTAEREWMKIRARRPRKSSTNG